MTTTTASPPALGARKATFVDAVRSEWTKLWSLRSTYWTMAIALVVTVGISALIAWAIVANWDQASPEDHATFDPVNNSFNGLILGQLVMAVLGALVVTSEYSTGGIRGSFIAVPRRVRFIGAKAVVLAAASLGLGIAVALIALAVCGPIFAVRDQHFHLSDATTLRATAGAALYIAGTAMVGFAIGCVLRHSAGAIATAVAVLFVLPLVLFAVPGTIGTSIRKFMPSNAGSQLSSVRVQADQLSPWVGYGVFTLEWAVVLAIGIYLIQRRDA